ISDSIILDGIPKDMDSAIALANKKDDRLRKEFEKWAILTYSDNRAVINEKKGADKGIDGIAYFLSSQTDTEKIVFQVKSGKVSRSAIATFITDMNSENARIGIFLTLEEPTKAMREEAMAAGCYEHKLMGRAYNRIQIVTVKEMIEAAIRLDMPLSLEVLKSAKPKSGQIQEQLSEL
ncbi:MAG: site-specific DNA-methyltransferase, partial [Desulfobacteraceae bacterium IS3]